MTTIRAFMTDDHRHCDDLFADAEQAAGKGQLDVARAEFGHFRQAVLAHFAAEESTLFPAFEARTGMAMGPTRVMRMEHEQIRALLADAVDALAAADSEEFLGIAETLLIMMQQHNMKEENILYPMCDEHLADVAGEVLARLEVDTAEP
ncbi:MAG: hemerythrin domain-containing protein [Betaproteobacteria bacterium]|nr:hemerythrin domain-containing protein [Betaproteobacteria bacterium]